MALVADSSNRGRRPSPVNIQPIDWTNPYQLQQPSYQAQQPSTSRWAHAMRGPVTRTTPHPQQLAAQQRGVTINLGGEQPFAGEWWEQPNRWRGGPSTPEAIPGVTPITPEPWGPTAQPLWEGAGAPTDWLNLRSQDWASMPREMRSYLETWLRGQGWRPGQGGWGRYGASNWQRQSGTDPWTSGQYLGEQAFAGVPEKMKPWLWFLSRSKGWAQGEAVRPETTGWGW